jgi:hypothetical protein
LYSLLSSSLLNTHQLLPLSIFIVPITTVTHSTSQITQYANHVTLPNYYICHRGRFPDPNQGWSQRRFTGHDLLRHRCPSQLLFFNSSFSNISPGFDRVNAHGKAKYRNQLSLQLFNKKYEKFCLELPVRIQRSLSDLDISKTISDAMWNSAVSSYRVTNGCCSFYDDKSCESHLFTADTRQHW